MDPSFVSFLGVSAVVIMTPGQDTALTIRNTLLGGRSAGIATGLGVAVGQSTWTLAAAIGLTALLVASEPVFAAIRWLGAGYLVYLGARSLWSAARPGGGHAIGAQTAGSGPRLAPRRAWRQGLLSSLGNPKLAVFFSSLLPQFVPAGAAPFPTMVGLGLVFAAFTLVWLVAYATIVARAGDLLRGGRIRRMLDAVMGTVLVALGLRLATEPG